tara:strand:- start:254 stop:361 length:108 start_codon:yes stop_codon:yes gene_type:complete
MNLDRIRSNGDKQISHCIEINPVLALKNQAQRAGR